MCSSFLRRCILLRAVWENKYFARPKVEQDINFPTLRVAKYNASESYCNVIFLLLYTFELLKQEDIHSSIYLLSRRDVTSMEKSSTQRHAPISIYGTVFVTNIIRIFLSVESYSRFKIYLYFRKKNYRYII